MFKENMLVPDIETEEMAHLRYWVRRLQEHRLKGRTGIEYKMAKDQVYEIGQHLSRYEIWRNGLTIPFVRYEDFGKITP